MKLYLVRCRNMQTSIAGQVAWGTAYIAAENPAEAYTKLRSFLDKEDIGFSKDREMQSVELIADTTQYPDCGVRFYP